MTLFSGARLQGIASQGLFLHGCPMDSYNGARARVSLLSFSFEKEMYRLMLNFEAGGEIDGGSRIVLAMGGVLRRTSPQARRVL